MKCYYFFERAALCSPHTAAQKREEFLYIGKAEKAYPAEEENKCPKPRKFTL